jgi:phage-related protein
MSNIRVKVLGDVSNFKSSMSDVERIAEITAGKVKQSFFHVSNFLKTTIGLTAVGVGIEQAVDSASKLVNLQKVQSQLIKNQGIQKQYQLTGDANATRWYSQRLDNMATELSLQNGINKASIVQAQTFIMSNQDLVTMTSSMKNGMKTVLSDAANIAEITGGNITSTTRMLTRMLADPAKSMSSMRRMGFQLSQAEQARIKALEKSGGLLKAQDLTIQLIGKHTQGIAAAAQSPVDLLKNEVALVWQSLGLGLLPILDELAKAIIEPVKALMPVLQFMGTTIATVASTLGSALGNIFKDLIPLFTLMTNSVIPALLNIITPLVKLVEAVLTPLSKAFEKLVGTKDKLGPLALIFQKIGDAINANLMKAVNSIAQSFNDMAKNGKLGELMNNLVQAFVTLAPILPDLATATAKLLIALTPLLVAALPDIVYLVKVFAELVRGLAPLITMLLTGITKIVQNLGPLKPVLVALAAVWFTRKLFLTPITMASEMVTGLIGKFKALKEIMLMSKISTGGNIVSKLAGVLAQRGGFGSQFGAFFLKAEQYIGKFGSALSKAGSLVKAFGSNFIMIIRTVGTAFVTVITETIIPALSTMFAFIMANPIVLAITAIVAAIAALIYLLVKHWKGFVTIMKAVWNTIVDAAKLAWKGVYEGFKWVWDKISAGINWLVGLFMGLWRSITNLGKTIWNGLVNGFIDAVNLLVRIWNDATGWIPGLGSAVHISTIQHIGGNPKTPVKRHNGGIVPGLAGREVPAILQAGEAVLTANQLKGMNNRGGNTLNVHPNAVNIVIHGNADAATTAQIKTHVEAQFKELHRTLKSMGR